METVSREKDGQGKKKTEGVRVREKDKCRNLREFQ